MKNVFVVQHEYEDSNVYDVKFVGVFSSRRTAQEAIQKLSKQPGFFEWPEGFEICEYKVDAVYWGEGFCIK